METTEAIAAATTSQTVASETTVIACEGGLDIAVAQELYRRLEEALAAARPVVLEAAQVERADAAVLQLLWVFFQEAHTRGIAVQWRQPAPALRHAARLLDLTAGLALPAK
jgi:anti-anti-sigma regulatory factor